MRLYEGMFVVESALADRDWDGCCAEIDSIIAKHGGKVVDLRKWDERRLAYEIKRVRRGTYILVHFETEPASMEAMRRDFNMSDKILRQLVLIDVDGVPSGDERPGITTSITDSSSFGHRGRRLPRRTREGEDAAAKASKDDSKDAGDEMEPDAAAKASKEDSKDAGDEMEPDAAAKASKDDSKDAGDEMEPDAAAKASKDDPKDAGDEMEPDAAARESEDDSKDSD